MNDGTNVKCNSLTNGYGEANSKVLQRKPREAISLTRRLEVLKLLCENKTQQEIAQQTGISQALVSRIWRRKKLILGDSFQNEFHKRKRCKRGKYYDLDRSMTEWYIMTRKFDLPVTLRMLSVKAKELSAKLGFVDFSPSYSWLKNWRDKNSVVCGRVDSLTYNSINEIDNYSNEDVYCLAEFGMYSTAVPGPMLSIISNYEKTLEKDRMTVLVACNQTGSDKCRLLAVGKERQPSQEWSLPCEYISDANAWISSDIFVQWLLNLDKEMISQNRRIIMILNDSSVHLREVEEDMSNIKLAYVNSDDDNSAICQPCNNGIIYNLKFHYRKEYMKRLNLDLKDFKLSLLDVLHMLTKAWMKVSPGVIQSAFSEAGFQNGTKQTITNSRDMIIEGLSQTETDNFVNLDSDLQFSGMLTDDQICDSVLAAKDEEEEDDGDDGDLDEMCGISIQVYGAANMVKTEEPISGTEALYNLAGLRRCLEYFGVSDFTLFYTVESQVFRQIQKTS